MEVEGRKEEAWKRRRGLDGEMQKEKGKMHPSRWQLPITRLLIKLPSLFDVPWWKGGSVESIGGDVEEGRKSTKEKKKRERKG